ncbi:enoyl-CoA hydratase [Sphingomonas sp. Leaf412]|uniref:enoyl-CoA hydratase-related protein n=1 Tax=Sphingomonas sp. Leaf412 TaxID=1736370 RepID=UPI000700430F|nr:enoyl-CoA hydratase-related protein [Sphingomonas sp. Leaf412]KQT35298.1 enoyl-CoA hydratase [Sphingomonas sp. Leaf412]
MAFDYRLSDGIGTITFDRPAQMNTLTRASAVALARLFDETDADDAVRALIVTGEGRAFCAGADLSGGGFGTGDDGSDPARDWGGILTMRIFDSVKPIVAAVNGVAAGVGATMQLPMDVRIASTDARFGFVFSRRGIVPESASSWFLPRVVGISRALDWCYSGRVFGADEALSAGLVRSLHAPGDLMEAARTLARTYVEGTAPVSVALTRRMMWRMLAEPAPMAAHLMESAMIPTRGRSADAREGVAAFMEKRAAVFPDTVSAGLPEV